MCQTVDGVCRVIPIFEPRVRSLCTKPYPGHPNGCPNFCKRPSCPPQAPLLPEVLDLSSTVCCVWNAFDLAAHVERLRARHPAWSNRQLRCCLYWQNAARKRLRERVDQLLEQQRGYIALYCPEGSGVNVTATMADVGIELEWPPVRVAHQVALVGKPLLP